MFCLLLNTDRFTKLDILSEIKRNFSLFISQNEEYRYLFEYVYVEDFYIFLHKLRVVHINNKQYIFGSGENMYFLTRIFILFFETKGYTPVCL